MRRTCNWCAWITGRRGITPHCGNMKAEHFTQRTEFDKSCDQWQLEPDINARADAARRDMGVPIPDVKVLPGARAPEVTVEPPLIRSYAREAGKSQWGMHEMKVGEIRRYSLDPPNEATRTLLNRLGAACAHWNTKYGTKFRARKKRGAAEVTLERLA